jgi:hypothetical protein
MTGNGAKAPAAQITNPVAVAGLDLTDFGTPPYHVRFTLEGTRDLIMNHYNPEYIREKENAPKGSSLKKLDRPEALVMRAEDGSLAWHTEGMRMAMCVAAQKQRDPSSPRASARGLYESGIAPVEEVVSLGVQDWDYLDERRARHSSSYITKIRPALYKGWRLSAMFEVSMPEYITPQQFLGTLIQAGRFVGLGDARKLGYGRFLVTNFEVVPEE